MRPPLPGPIFQDFNLLRSAALAGQGAALCPLAMIRPDIEAGFLTALSDTPRPVGSDYYLLTRTRAPQDLQAKVAVFRDWVLAEAGTAGAVRST
jgi:DNA-binding transcriptional LysR family regulator